MRGDASLFARAGEVEFAWERIGPLLGFRQDGAKPEGYVASSEGPEMTGKSLGGRH